MNGSNIIPNGDFTQGLNGWFFRDDVRINDQRIWLKNNIFGIVSPTFRIIPGKRYLISVTRTQLLGTVKQDIQLVIHFSKTYANNLYSIENSHVLKSETHPLAIHFDAEMASDTLKCEWTAPAGFYFASLGLAQRGSAEIGFTNFCVEDAPKATGSVDEKSLEKPYNPDISVKVTVKKPLTSHEKEVRELLEKIYELTGNVTVTTGPDFPLPDNLIPPDPSFKKLCADMTQLSNLLAAYLPQDEVAPIVRRAMGYTA